MNKQFLIVDITTCEWLNVQCTNNCYMIHCISLNTKKHTFKTLTLNILTLIQNCYRISISLKFRKYVTNYYGKLFWKFHNLTKTVSVSNDGYKCCPPIRKSLKNRQILVFFSLYIFSRTYYYKCLIFYSTLWSCLTVNVKKF